MSRSRIFATCLAFLAAISCSAQVVTTFAGGLWIFPGGGGPAVNAPLGVLNGIAVDSSGNVFVSDTNNLVVVKINSAGVITVVAGTGYEATTPLGDNGPAANAPISPRGLAFDASGNLYLCDVLNVRIRRVTPQGIITTVAGNGTAGFAGDGGPATSASINNPSGIVFDAQGNLYIADTSNNRVRKVTPAGIISTVAGNGTGGSAGDGGLATSAQLYAPTGVAVDGSGNLYIADSANNRIRKVTAGGSISTAAGGGTGSSPGDGGPATQAVLSDPYGVSLDAAGNLYISEVIGSRIRKVTLAGVISTVAGSPTAVQGFGGDGGPATSAYLGGPTGSIVDSSGNLYIADSGNDRVRKVAAATGIITTVAGDGSYRFSGDGGLAANAVLDDPQGIAFDSAGNAYILDAYNSRVRKVDPSGIITTVAGGGSAGFGEGGLATNASLYSPLTAIAVDSSANIFIVTGNRVRKISATDHTITTVVNLQGGIELNTAGSIGDGGPAINAGLYYPSGLAIDNAGNLYISDTGNNVVRKVTPAGIISSVTIPLPGYGVQEPMGLAADSAGNIYVADYGESRIRKLTPSGAISTFAGGGNNVSDGIPATNSVIAGPTQVAVDALGNVYLGETAGIPIRKIDPTGIISSLPATGTSVLNQASGLATDAAGNLYVAEALIDTVYKVAFNASGTLPAINSGGIVNVASYSQPPLVPGSIAALFGTGLAPSATAATSTPLPVTIGGSGVTVNGVAAPLFFVSPGQTNFQIPWEAAGPLAASVAVTFNNLASGSDYYTPLAQAAPGIFSTDSSGTGQGATLNANTTTLANAATPAARGGYVSIFCTGLGAVTNPPATGAPAGPSSTTLLTPVLTIGGVTATPSFSGLAPGYVGLYQVNVQIPTSVAPGSAVPLTMTVGGVTSNQVTIAIQ